MISLSIVYVCVRVCCKLRRFISVSINIFNNYYGIYIREVRVKLYHEVIDLRPPNPTHMHQVPPPFHNGKGARAYTKWPTRSLSLYTRKREQAHRDIPGHSPFLQGGWGRQYPSNDLPGPSSSTQGFKSLLELTYWVTRRESPSNDLLGDLPFTQGFNSMHDLSYWVTLS